MLWTPAFRDREAGELVARDAEEFPIREHLDRSTRWAAIILTVVFWAFAVGVQTLRSYVEGRPDYELLTAVRLGGAIVGAGFCFALHLVIRSLERRAFHVRVLAMGLMVPIVADAFSWVMYLAYRQYAPDLVSEPSASATIQGIVYWCWFFLAWAALYLALRYSFEIKDAERRARAILGQAHVAKLKALRHQINPHFMFNTLNSISALILDGEATRAEAMVSRLADFFRLSLALDPLEDVPLQEELNLQRLYLQIEQVRFPDMNVAVSLAPGLQNALVPPFILQPIVENSIKYSASSTGAPPAITIDALANGDRLVLTVRDSGPGSGAGAGTGTGLRNVRARLSARFEQNYSLEAGPAAPDGYEVRISMPLRYPA